MAKNDFEDPKVLKGDRAAIYHIIRLIIADPGTYPLHPEMGVGLYSNYRYGWNDEILTKLRSHISEQLSIYMPELSGVSVNVKAVKHQVLITIQFNSTIVTLVSDDKNKTLSIADLKGE